MQNINWENITEEKFNNTGHSIEDLTDEDRAAISQTSWYRAMSIPTLLENVRDLYQSIFAGYFRMQWNEEQKENPNPEILATCANKLKEFSSFFHNEEVMSIVNDYEKLYDYYQYLREQYKPFKVEFTASGDDSSSQKNVNDK